MAWWASAAPFLALLALPFAAWWPVLARARGPAWLLLLLPAFWSVPLLAAVLFFNRLGFDKVNGVLLGGCLAGWVLQVAVAGYAARRRPGLWRLALISVLANAPATVLAVIALGQGASGASL